MTIEVRHVRLLRGDLYIDTAGRERKRPRDSKYLALDLRCALEAERDG